MKRLFKKKTENVTTPSYEKTYLKVKRLTSRQPVYISKPIHQSVSRFVHLWALTNKGISVGAYVDNILAEHLEQHKEEIKELYCHQKNDLL